MKHFTLFFVVILAFITQTCQKQTKLEYKYADKNNELICNNLDTKLINEAIYTFEDDLINKYDPEGKNIRRAYASFIHRGVQGTEDLSKIVSPHTIAVFIHLKQIKNLWNLDGTDSKLNYNSKYVKCIANNIKYKNLKNTFNALLKTNSMKPKLFGAPLTSKYQTMQNDKYLTAYTALDLYYAKLFDIDLTQIIFNEQENNNTDAKSGK